LIKDKAIRRKVKESFEKEFQKSMLLLKDDKSRQQKYASLKLEGIIE
jgi:hypothetical protein